MTAIVSYMYVFEMAGLSSRMTRDDLHLVVVRPCWLAVDMCDENCW